MASQPVRDDDAIRRLHAYAREHHTQWNQEVFREVTECGTTYCMAGFQVFIFDGCIPVTDPGHPRYPSYGVSGAARTPDGRVRDVADLAAESLGLNDDEAHALFHHAMTPTVVAHTVERVLANDFR